MRRYRVEMKPRRFFYHYYRQVDRMSVHFKNTCHVVDHVRCQVPCEDHRRRTQPRLVMRGFARQVRIFKEGEAVIASIE